MQPPKQYPAPVDEKMAVAQLASSIRDSMTQLHVDLADIGRHLQNISSQLSAIAKKPSL